MKIRPYQEKDFENCREVCRVTAHGYNTEDAVSALWNMYCDYYLQKESGSCFVAANDADEAVGYILCAPDYEKYEKTYKEFYLKDLKKLSRFRWLVRIFEFKFNRMFAKDYPAHLHIDIFPEYQRMGLGHKLVDTLVAHLKELKVKGVFLIVGSGNKTGISFYEKYGFKKLKRLTGGIVYGIDIGADK